MSSDKKTSEDFTFEIWLNQIIEAAFLPGAANMALPCDDQGVVYL